MSQPSHRAAQLRIRIGEGLRFVATHPVLRATAITSATGNLAFAIASPVSILFLARTLSLSARQIGGVVAIGSLAAMVGAALAPRLARRIGSARVIWLPLAVTGPLTLIGPFAQPGPLVVLALIGTAAGESGQIIYAITNVSLRQRLCPEHMLGRVNATMRFLIMGLFPLGALIGGALGELIGVRATLWLSFGLISISPAPMYGVLRHVRDVEDCGIRR